MNSTSSPLDSPLDSSFNSSSLLQPTKLKKTLPPKVLLRIFYWLPLSALVNVALVSRRFKVLAYDDEIWDDKLKPLLQHDAGPITSTLVKHEGSLIAKELELFINNRPLNELIRGLQTDPYNSRARAKSTGEARERFKQVYTQLAPYYLDLRHRHSKESKILRDFGSTPMECGKTLNLLVGLGQVHAVEDWKEINEGVDALCQYFESASLHEFEVAYDSQNLDNMKIYAHSLVALNDGSICIQTFIQKHQIFYDNPFNPEDNFKASDNDLEPFKKFMTTVTDELNQQAHIVSQVFPAKIDVFYTFADRVFEDVISEYITQLLGIAHNKGIKLYLHTTSIALSLMTSLVDAITNPDLPSHLDQERGTNLLLKLLLPFMENYLFEEHGYVDRVCEDGINKWNNRPSAQQEEDARRLTNQSRETFKRNYLSAFKKVIALPVDLVSSAATTIASPFQRSSQVVKQQPGDGKQDDGTSPSTPRSSMTTSRKAKTGSITSLSSVSSTKSPSTPTTLSIGSSSDSMADANDTLENAQTQLDMIQDLLSLELALQLIHINKDSERRVKRFIGIGFTGRIKQDIQSTYEQIFIRLLQALGTEHIKPAFERASSELLQYKPKLESTGNNDDLPPLTDFFELIHVADVIQQMVQLYYDEEMTQVIDKHDFMNDVNKEKKVFERMLDDCVAQGMDHGIQVLLSQVELILTSEQSQSDYNPQGDTIDLKPTKACLDVIQCLKSNTCKLHGAAEKSTMDLFFSEVGRRFFEVLSKHLKTQTVNESGGIRYICDMNAYYDFVSSLRQKTVTPYFLALKSLANLYIIDSAPDIKNVIHDLERYHGLMRVEDLFEFASCRSDWAVIRKVVQKDMTDCSIM
ncbi:exocyst complex component Sec10-like protein [Chlamydoabsidia padenii]|nr:exocyst complex component Sec10-like protein [Chlamydoabsidia padenii]